MIVFLFLFFPFQSSQVQKIKGKICNKQLCYPTTVKQNRKKNIFQINGDQKNPVRRNVTMGVSTVETNQDRDRERPSCQDQFLKPVEINFLFILVEIFKIETF